MIISVVGQKGGVGKTTVAICLASEWVRQGLKVLLVDTDPQGSTMTWGEVAREQGHPAPSVIQMGADLWRKEQLPVIGAPFDRIVVDSPPRMGTVQRGVMLAADLALLPCGAGPTDAWALAETLKGLEDARSLADHEIKSAILLTQIDNRTAMGRSARTELEAGLKGVDILDIEIGDRIAYPEAIAYGKGVTTHAPGSAAAKEIQALTEIIERIINGEAK